MSALLVATVVIVALFTISEWTQGSSFDWPAVILVTIVVAIIEHNIARQRLCQDQRTTEVPVRPVVNNIHIFFIILPRSLARNATRMRGNDVRSKHSDSRFDYGPPGQTTRECWTRIS